MDENNKEETKKSDEMAPVGTWVLMLTVSFSMVVAWLFLYYGVFLPRGAIG